MNEPVQLNTRAEDGGEVATAGAPVIRLEGIRKTFCGAGSFPLTVLARYLERRLI